MAKGIVELEQKWHLRCCDERFRKLRHGKWEVVFERRKPKPKRMEALRPLVSDLLVAELTKRGVGSSTATELAATHPEERIRQMTELFDWHNARGEERGAGFLVAGIRSPEAYRLPRGFETSEQRQARQRAGQDRIRAAEKARTLREAKQMAQEEAELAAFQEFLDGKSPNERDRFEREALATANRNKLHWLTDAEKSGSPVADAYRRAILMDHYRQVQAAQACLPFANSQKKADQMNSDNEGENHRL